MKIVFSVSRFHDNFVCFKRSFFLARLSFSIYVVSVFFVNLSSRLIDYHETNRLKCILKMPANRIHCMHPICMLFFRHFFFQRKTSQPDKRRIDFLFSLRCIDAVDVYLLFICTIDVCWLHHVKHNTHTHTSINSQFYNRLN